MNNGIHFTKPLLKVRFKRGFNCVCYKGLEQVSYLHDSASSSGKAEATNLLSENSTHTALVPHCVEEAMAILILEGQSSVH